MTVEQIYTQFMNAFESKRGLAVTTQLETYGTLQLEGDRMLLAAEVNEYGVRVIMSVTVMSLAEWYIATYPDGNITRARIQVMCNLHPALTEAYDLAVQQGKI